MSTCILIHAASTKFCEEMEDNNKLEDLTVKKVATKTYTYSFLKENKYATSSPSEGRSCKGGMAFKCYEFVA
jgi:hypothetical protein